MVVLPHRNYPGNRVAIIRDPDCFDINFLLIDEVFIILDALIVLQSAHFSIMRP
jgi:hypothetical protein